MRPASVRIRPFDTADTTAVRALFRRWGDRSVEQRFFAMSPSLADGYVDALGDPDRTLFAVVAGNAAGDIVGVGSTHRLGADRAEFGLSVDDGVQGRGVGTRLLAALLHDADRRNLSALVAYVEPANQQMLEVIRDELPDATRERRDGVVTVTVPVGTALQHASAHLREDVVPS